MKSSNFKSFTVITGEEVLIMKSASPEGEPALITTLFFGDDIGVGTYIRGFDRGTAGHAERNQAYNDFSQNDAQHLFDEGKAEIGEGCECPSCVAARADRRKKQESEKIIH